MDRRVIRKLPRPVFYLVRWAYRTFKYHAWRMRPTRDGRDPFDHVGKHVLNSIYREIRLKPHSLLHIPSVRMTLARERIRALLEKKDAAIADRTDAVIHNAMEYNLAAAKTAPDLDRPSLLVNVVSSIQRVRHNIKSLDVLSIGPRSEIEIFALHAAGFDPNRVKALDLFSYSPYVDIGDMHAMPYADRSFDVVLAGWVLAYSRDPAKAAREIVRICREGAIVVASADFTDPPVASAEFNYEETVIKNVDQLLGYFGEFVGTVYFRHNPDHPGTHMVMTAFEIRKPEL